MADALLQARSTIATPRTMRGAAVASIGTALPRTSVPNSVIARRLGVEDSWIVKRLGVRERRVAQPDERLTDLAIAAARDALERARTDGEALDFVLVATTSQDELMPNTAPLVASALGATRAGAVDLGAACMGFLSALAVATPQVESGRADTVLIVGADTYSRFLDADDRRTAALFGDGAGAAVITPVAAPGKVGPCVLRANDVGADLVYIRHDDVKLRMEGQETFRYAVDYISAVTRRAVSAAGIGLDDVDLFVYHQANTRILRAVGQALELPAERVVDCIATTGNTAAASIPLALAHARDEGRLFDGARVLLGAIGAGFTWGATVVEWGPGDA